MSACKKCVGESVSIVVPAWWAVNISQAGIGIVTR